MIKELRTNQKTGVVYPKQNGLNSIPEAKAKMKQGILLLQRCPCFPSLPSPSISFQIPASKHPRLSITASISSANAPQQELTAKERRQLRNQRRELNAGYNWREQVEDRLIKKPKTVLPTAGEARNLDNLADLGPQWYVVRVARVDSHLTADLIAKLLARDYPDLEFKVNLQYMCFGF